MTIKPRWCARDKVWLMPGEVSEVTGRRKYVILRDEEGRKVKGNDHIGKVKAMLRLQAQRDLGPTVREVIRRYLEWHTHRSSKLATISDLQFHLFNFGRFEHQGVRYFDRPASSIMLRDLAQVRKSMEARGCKTGYTRHLYSAVLACWRWASRPIEDREPERLLDTNPLEGAERPKAGKVRKMIIPWPTIEALLSFAERRASETRQQARAIRKVMMLRLVAESGCRPLEACSLEWDWVHEKDRIIVIPPAYHKTGWHRGDYRMIGLTERMAEDLGQLRASIHTVSHPRWVFALIGDRDRSPSRHGFDHWFASLRTRAIEAGISIPLSMTLYSLRHSLVTQAHQGGISYQDLAAHMGHSEHIAEEIYSHLDPTFVRAQFDSMHAARTKRPDQE